MLTQKQINQYVKDGEHCPFCSCDEISVYDTSAPSSKTMESIIICNNCEKVWVEVYELRYIYKIQERIE